jgi:alkanesulfonate monooxygenase SsuD/methylene tetrahydromethanopterin reductase-like flavin-dependent oxidoreductase (luciferase family)
MARVTARQSFVGTPLQVATSLNDMVQADASDGFILVPYLTPGGLDEFALKVIPILQEWGVFRADYEGTTLRDHLGLAEPRAAVTAGGV